MKKFSLLMSVYDGDCPKLFYLAFQSILDSATQPSEVVLVKDGPIRESLEDVINDFKKYLNFKIITLKNNSGLHHALNYGLKNCSYNLVIRADADDVNEKHRFTTLLEYSYKYDLIGSYIQEYKNHFKTKQSVRKVPHSADQILRFAKMRNPFNHQSVLFKKNLILKIGGYPNIKGFEDYALWGKCIKSNLRMKNINTILVKANAGNSIIERRRGVKYLKNNFKLAVFLKKIGIINFYEFFFFLALRSCFILAPRELKKNLYEKFMRSAT